MVTSDDLCNEDCRLSPSKSRSSSLSSESTSPSRYPRASICSGSSSSDAGSWDSFKPLQEPSRALSARRRLLTSAHAQPWSKLPNVSRRGYDRSTDESWSMVFAGKSPRDHLQTSYGENVRRACRDWLRTPARSNAKVEDFLDVVDSHPPVRVKPAWWSVPRPPSEKRTKSSSRFGGRRCSMPSPPSEKRAKSARSFGGRRYVVESDPN